MTAIILRRRKLGRTSAREIARLSTTGIKVVRNWCESDRLQSDPDFVFRWGCTSCLTDIMPNTGNSPVIINTAVSISWCSDKKRGRLDMQEAGVPVPRTFSDLSDWARGKVSGKEYVLRPRRHAQGRNMCISETLGGMSHFVAVFPDFYISELIYKVKEFRVFVCQGRVVWVAEKTPGNPDDIAWNVAMGGRFDNVKWSAWNTKVLQAALDAAKVSKTDFCGVDVMVDAEGLPYVLEVNSAPSQTSPYRQSCVAKAFDYIVHNGKRHFDDVTWSPRKTYKSYIHPAVREPCASSTQ